MINKYNFRSFFTKTFIMLMAAFTLLIILYNVVFISIMQPSYMNSLADININMLSKTTSLVDLILSNIEDEINLVAQDENIINAALVPTLSKTARNLAILSRLRDIARANPLIESIYFYIPDKDLVFTSNEQIILLDSFYDTNAITEYDKNGGSTNSWIVRRTAAGPAQDYAITYYKDFPKEQDWRMGQIIVTLSKSHLNEYLQNQLGDLKSGIAVMDSSGQIILGESSNSSSYQTSEGLAEIFIEPSGYYRGSGLDSDNYYFHTTSSLTDWKFLCQVDILNLLQMSNVTLALFIPALLVYLIISFVIAFFMCKNLSVPIDRLVHVVAQNQNDNSISLLGTFHNEYELIGNSYYSVMQEKNKMAQVVRDSIPLVTESLFNQLFHGKTLTKKEYLFFDQYLDMKKVSSSKYAVLVLQIDRNVTSSIGSTIAEYQFDFNKIKNRLMDMISSIEKNIYITPDQTKIIVLCCFPYKVNDTDIQQLTSAFAHKIKVQLYESNIFTITIGIGRCYQGIENIKTTYDEAIEALKYKLYMGTDNIINIEDVEDNDSVEETQQDSISQFYIEEIRRVINAISTGDCENTSQNLYAFFKSIKTTAPQENHYINHIFMKLLDSLAQFAITSEIPISDILGKEKKIYHELEKMETFVQLMKFTSDICHSVAKRVDGQNHYKGHRYMLKAQEYITENYTNSEISLNCAAEYIGINSAYLSKLFKEEFNENFIDYINRLRINKAKELLNSTRITVKEVGYAVGFNSIQNFIRTFKKHEGITPGKYNQYKTH